MSDIFSWQNINYVVPVSGGEHKQLLDDVSGYVSPGKLTALMGESGAGKVRPLSSTSTCVLISDTHVILDNPSQCISGAQWSWYHNWQPLC
jgi:ATP-binding cassette subfamily G (WHITE) protein 2 (SNQ2)